MEIEQRKTDEQREEHISSCIEKQEEGNLRDKREHGEPRHVALHVRGVAISLGDEERHDGKGEAADALEYTVEGEAELILEYVRGMVAGHRYDSDDLEGKRGESSTLIILRSACFHEAGDSLFFVPCSANGLIQHS